MDNFNETDRLFIGLELGSRTAKLLESAGLEPSNDIEQDFVDATELDLITFESTDEARFAFEAIAAVVAAAASEEARPVNLLELQSA